MKDPVRAEETLKEALKTDFLARRQDFQERVDPQDCRKDLETLEVMED